MKRTSEQILTEWLVLQIQSGSREARNRLVSRWQPLLQRYAQRQLHDEEDARDVVQDTFITVFGRIHTLRDPAAFPKWVYQILHRRCVDLIRRRHRTRTKTEGEPSRHGTDPSVVPNYEAELDVAAALAKLSRESYLAVHLHYLHGLSLQDIADIGAVPVGTIKSRLFNARRLLRRYLGGDDE